MKHSTISRVMAHLGRKKSAKKTAAARINGSKGGYVRRCSCGALVRRNLVTCPVCGVHHTKAR